MADAVARGISDLARANAVLIQATEAEERFPEIDAAAGIIFGSPTHFGGVSSVFHAFMEKTGPRWAEQRWSGKLAGGFTTSEWPSGDKLQTLVQLSLFAAQHGMHWVNPGLSPVKGGQVGHCNRLGGWLGVMGQALGCRQHPAVDALDLEAAERLGSRVSNVARSLGVG